MIGLAAVADNWHEERPPRPLQVADDRHAVEAAVEQQQPGLQPRLAHQEQQLLEYLLRHSELTGVTAKVNRWPWIAT